MDLLTIYLIGFALTALLLAFGGGRAGNDYDTNLLIGCLLGGAIWPFTAVLFVLAVAHRVGKR